MENFSAKAFEDVFNGENNIDYIASCTSEWHLISALTFLNNLYEKKQRKLHGIIIICEHSKNGYIIRESLLNLPSKFGAILYKRDKTTEVKYKDIHQKILFAQDNELYIMSVIKPWLKMSLECRKLFQCKIVDVIIDEGVGCYGSIFTRTVANYQELRNIKATSREVLLEIYSYIILFLLQIPVKKYLLLRRKGGKYVENQVVVEHFRKIQKELLKQKILFKPVYPYAILLTQPLEEQGCTNVEAVLQCFCDLKEKCEEMGITLYVKTHPRYPSKKYEEKGFLSVEDQIGIENLLASVIEQPDFICGFNTTALITSKLLYDIKSYSLSRLILEKQDIGNNYFRRMLEKYDKKFKTIVPEFSYNCLESYGERSC